MATNSLAYLIHHLVLPPKLPQSDDFDPQHERILLRTTIHALQEFRTHLSNPVQSLDIQSVVSTVTNLLNSRHTNGSVSESQLSSTLAGLNTSTDQGMVPVEVKAQNAGILISKDKHSIVFESFELSPTNQESVAAKGRLVRSFPAYASMISIEAFQDIDLRASLAQAIAKLSSQPASGFQPQVRKAKQDHDEMRDTTHPGMVTNLLMNIISALGKPFDVPTIWKNTREEVLWSNAKLPWRRSPLWLLLRVSIQLQLSRSAAKSGSNESLYKPFMVFLLSKVLDSASRDHHALGSEILYATSAKLSRRIKKLEAQNKHSSPAWLDPVVEILSSAHGLIHERWKHILDGTEIHVNAEALETLRPETELDVDLPELNKFIAGIAARKQCSSNSKFEPTAGYPKFLADELPSGFKAYGEYQYFRLFAIESWVECHLQSWLDVYIREQETTKKIRDLIRSYHDIAKSTYAHLPSSMSIMYLTIIELWVACDKSTCQIHPLLREFDPEIPVELLQSLLLPLRSQMRRLCDIESYVFLRRELTSQHAPSPFRSFGDPSSFAVKFFDQSPLHQALLSRIKHMAADKKQKKCRELSEKKQDYRNYMAQYDLISECEYRWVVTNSVYGVGEDQHASDCPKCYWKSKAESIEIGVYEWPLSSNPYVEKATAFELDVPEVFRSWRDVSIYLLRNVFESTYQSQVQPRVSYHLSGDHGLSSFFSHAHCQTGRIVLLSQVKPNSKTHRNQKGNGAILNLTDGDVCVNNGLQYEYLDEVENVFTKVFCSTDEMLQRCTYTLPARSVQLQKYLLRPPSRPDGVPSNEVIASQSECPIHISLEEYRAFGALPFGCRIQYKNILIQLSMPALDFAKVETQLLILQTISQAGCPSTESIPERVAHRILAEEDFGGTMMDQLEVALKRVSENWESWRALAIFVQLTTRLLTLATSLKIQARCRAYLDRARKASLRWLNAIKSRAHASVEDEQRAGFYSTAVEIALLCISTFDVDQNHMIEILHEPTVASILLQCSIAVQENKDAVSSEHDPLYCAMLQSWRSIAYRTFPIVENEIICHGSNCLDDAVTASWSGFHSASSWQSLRSP